MNIRNKSKTIIKTVLSRYALPLLYAFVVMKLILSSYLLNEDHLLYGEFALYECALFFIFEKLKTKKILRGLAYVALAAVLFYGVGVMIQKADNETRYSFTEWFYLNVQTVGEVREYLMAVFLGLGFFIVSITYYFTIIRYRTIGLLMVTVFPFAIYGKRGESLGNFDITLMLTVFLALMVHARQVSDDKRSDNRGTLIVSKAYLGVIAVFVSFVGAMTMIVPKPALQSRLEQNKELFNYNLFTVQKTDYDDYTNSSSPRYGADATGEILFNFTATKPEEVFYLRRQSFDAFKDNKWVLKTGYRLESYCADLDNEELRNVFMPIATRDLALRLAKTGRYDEYGLSEENFTVGDTEASSSINEYSQTFGPNYIPAPLCTDVDMVYAGGLYLSYRGDMARQSYGTELLNAQIIYSPENDSVYSAARSSGLTWENYQKALLLASVNGDISGQLYNSFMDQKQLYTSLGDCSDKLKELAHEITDKYESDYDKATALVDYFEDNDYTYDLDYIPEDESVDYFVFTSKKGACANYATAMTLMARAVGVPARYVEGFAVDERNDYGEYVVRDSCAHAYVEVLIPGMGWMTFDPTVPGYLDQRKKATDQSSDFNTDVVTTFISYFSQMILFLAVIFVVVFVLLLDRISETVFRIRISFADDREKALRLYRRTLKLLENSSGERLKGLTPEQLAEYAETHRQADITPISQLFVKVCFGGYEPAEEEVGKVYEHYKQLWKLLIGKKKNKSASAAEV